MKKILFAVMLITALSLSACNSPQASSASSASSVSSSGSASAASSELGVEIAKGMSLDQMGYMCEQPLNVKIKDDIFLDEWSDTDNGSQWVDGLAGEDATTLLSVYFYGPHSLGSSPLYFMCLQAFSTEETQGTKQVKIGDEKYSFSDLEQYTVYKTDDICVYDIYPLLNGEDLKTLITEQVDSQNKMVKKCVAATAEEREKYNIIMTEEDYVTYEDYDHLHDIAQYYKNNIAKLITKKPQAGQQITAISYDEYINFMVYEKSPAGALPANIAEQLDNERTQEKLAETQKILQGDQNISPPDIKKIIKNGEFTYYALKEVGNVKEGKKEYWYNFSAVAKVWQSNGYRRVISVISPKFEGLNKNVTVRNDEVWVDIKFEEEQPLYQPKSLKIVLGINTKFTTDKNNDTKTFFPKAYFYI